MKFTFTNEFPKEVVIRGNSDTPVGDFTIDEIKLTKNKLLSAILDDINMDKSIVQSFQRYVPEGARERNIMSATSSPTADPPAPNARPTAAARRVFTTSVGGMHEQPPPAVPIALNKRPLSMSVSGASEQPPPARRRCILSPPQLPVKSAITAATSDAFEDIFGPATQNPMTPEPEMPDDSQILL
jgi:hypothetical protein